VPSLAELNELPAGAVRSALLGICAAPAWAGAMAASRPYQSADELLARSDAAVAALTAGELEQALAGHPRIGASTAGHRWSASEQARAAAASEQTSRALADGNAAYERKFGHIYLVCASGRSGPELLALLQARLAHDAESEWRETRSEMKKINRIRLGKLIGSSQ
jgi:2-oxo-4-hydroxy-4-carboxy-5-ureidoimidazoline decarboxylase